ncbi:MAG: DUF308 domain-containing protein [Candidatus Eremiobacteraeota bacterium]|nr:DUF308 domain-containing protein [Candidatus Eremiobacteraeota bacterium]
MVLVLKANWWTLALRGVIAILFGIAAFVWPSVTALAWVILLAAFAFVEGIFALIAAFGWGLAGGQRLLMILIGLFGLAVGIVAIKSPIIVAAAVVIWVAWWAILTGILSVVVAVEMRRVIQNEWLLVIGALLSIIFGVLLLWQPLAGILTLTWLFGFYAIIYGVVMLSLGFRLKKLVEHPAV